MLELNKVYEGDCLKILPLMDDESVDLVLCDGPYLKKYSTGHRKNVKRSTTEIKNDREFPYNELFSSLKRIVKPDGHLYMFGCWQTGDYIKQELEKEFKIKNCLTWVKNNWSAGDLWWQYGQSYEQIWFATNGRKKLNGRRDRDCLFFDRVAGNKQTHLNEKPLDLMKFLVEKSSKEGDIVLDPFSGTGCSLVAAKELGRNYIGIELEGKYCEIAKERLNV